MTPEYLVAALLIFIGIAHSVLGELELLRPLFAADWKIAVPKFAVVRIVRGCWHALTLAWFALAAVAAGLDSNTIIAVMGFSSAAVVFFGLRGHLSWPIFGLIGFAAAEAAGWLPNFAYEAAAWIAIGLLGSVSLLHVYWATGGKFGFANAVPSIDGKPLFVPPTWLTVWVAGALAVAGGVLFSQLIFPTIYSKWLCIAAALVFGLRAVGDFKFVGFTKTQRGSRFATLDDSVFTPVVVFLALGAIGALLA